jgi:hypothetical protein
MVDTGMLISYILSCNRNFDVLENIAFSSASSDSGLGGVENRKQTEENRKIINIVFCSRTTKNKELHFSFLSDLK